MNYVFNHCIERLHFVYYGQRIGTDDTVWPCHKRADSL